MEIDWQNITIEYIEPQFQAQELNYSELQTFSTQNQMSSDIQQQMTEETELEDYIEFDPDDLIEEVYDEDEELNMFQGNLKRKFDSIKENESGTLYYCKTCSLDFPSIAYLKRHYNTKKHQRALKMEQRGRKFCQRRKYVRKNEFVPTQIKTLTDLTSEEVELLHMFDEQISKIQDEKSVKDFYENFNFDLDIEEEQATEAPVKFTSTEEILADLIKSSEKFLVKEPKVEFVTEEVQVPKVCQPIFKSNYPQQGTEGKKHYCFICNKTFNQQCHYTQHMNSVHAGNRNFKCEKCGKKYPEKYLLDNHMKKHFEENKKFKCEVCPRSYNNKVDLKRHEKTHQDVRDHVCKICGNGFVRFDHLQKHYAVHQKRMSMGLGDRIRSRRGLVAKQSVY